MAAGVLARSRTVLVGVLGLALLGATVSAQAAESPPPRTPGASSTPSSTAEATAGPRAKAGASTGTSTAPTTSNAVYAYDAAGRLVGVTDPAGETARYRFDAAGNRLAVERFASASLSVLSMVPVRAAAGARVTLSGTGFAPAAVDNTVVLGGKPATVVSATATRLVVQVPAEAATGKAVVGVAGASAESTETFTPATGAPEVTDPGAVAGIPGTTVVLQGRNFAPVATDNLVRFNGTLAEVTAAVPTSLTVKVPPGATTGPVTLVTPDGRTTAVPSFTIAFDGSGEVESTATTSYTATTPATVGVVSSGNLAEVQFDASIGDDVAFAFNRSTFGRSIYVQLLDPRGRIVPDFSEYAREVNGRLAVRGLPASGRYTLVLNPQGARGTVDVTASRNLVAAPLSTTGPSATVTFPRPGQGASTTFSATAGDNLVLAVTNRLSESATLSIVKPSGEFITNGRSILAGSSEAFRMNGLSETGTYKVFVAPHLGVTGSVGLTLSEDLPVPVTVDGGSVSTPLTRPGQRVMIRFTGPAGGEVSFAATGNTVAQYTEAYISGPGLGSNRYVGQFAPSRDGVMHLRDLQPGGAYTLAVTADSAATGTFTTWLSTPLRVGPLADGTPLTASTTRPGQQVHFTVDPALGSAGSVNVSGLTLGDTRIFARFPGDSADRDYGTTTTGKDIDLRGPLPPGEHLVIVRPQSAATGSAVAELLPDVLGGTLTVGGPRLSATLTRPGQNARYAFTTTAGGYLRLDIEASPYSWELSVRAPDGSWVTNARWVGDSSTYYDLYLPGAGTYTLTAAPDSAAIGTFTLGLSAATARRAQDGKPATAQAPAPRTPVAPLRGSEPVGPDAWRPGKANLAGEDWRWGRGGVPEEPPVLRAPVGRTALTGQVLKLDGKPLAGVSVRVGAQSSRTDARGRFVLAGIDAQARTLVVDGATANTSDRTYGRFDIRIHPKAGKSVDLGFPVWMTPLDTRNTVRFEAPATRDVVLKTPRIPGLEVRIPKGSVVRDEHGRAVTELGITAIPIDRAPFPLPAHGIVPVYFTVQPGGTYVFPRGAQIVYPNYTHRAPGTRVDFMDYDPKGKGWHVYGHGQVSPDGKQVVPDAKTRVWAFHGAMFNTSDTFPFGLSRLQDAIDWLSGDPVDLASGMLTDTRTDLAVSGDLGSVQVDRSYWQGDTRSRAFGVGRDLSYNVFFSSKKEYEQVDLYMPGGVKVHMVRTSPGTGYTDAVFEPLDTQSGFRGAKLINDRAGKWELRFRDGAVWIFPQYRPLQEIRDRHGNAVRITRMDDNGKQGPVVRVDAPGGRWVKFSYDEQLRVSKARDNTGRSVLYGYDAAGRLATVTDPAGKQSTYTYDGTSNRIATATDARGITYLNNEYDGDGRVRRQVLPEGAEYVFVYRKDATGNVTATEVMQPGGAVRRVEFDALGHGLADTQAYGTPLARRTVFQRGPANRVDSVTDPFGRRSDITYDTNGNVTSVTRLAGTANARSSATTVYDGPFDQPTKVTDPLGAVTLNTYDPAGNAATITDPEGRTTTFTYRPDGQTASAEDATGAVTRYHYSDGTLVSVEDPMGRTAGRFTDAAGRVTVLTDTTGSRTMMAYDRLNQPTRTTDPLGQALAFGYDANGNLTSLTDARGNASTWTFDNADRPKTATDPLGAQASFGYDPAGRLSTATSRDGKVSTSTYDLLGRPDTVRYGVTSPVNADSTATYEYDAVGLPRRITDSRAGVRSFTYDVLDRPRTVTGPTGTVTYTHDDADRRTGTEAAGVVTTYGYDRSSFLKSVKTGTQEVTFTPDALGRERTATLPGGIVRTTGYDAAGSVTSIGYARGATPVGDLAYARDARGFTAGLSGSLASVALPAAESGSVFDEDNRLTSFAGRSLTYDNEGRLTGDGLRSYTWDARGRLTGLTPAGSGQTTALGYDAGGIRFSKKTGTVEKRSLADGSNPFVEQDAAGATTATVAMSGLDEYLTRTEGGQTQVYLTDALGTVVGLAHADGTVATRYTYDPNGQVTRTGAESTNPYTFTGREDDGTGLLYHRARYYDPQTGRFISQDPIGHAGGPNLYQYALSAPTAYTDPTGNNPLLIGCAVGAAVDGAMDWGAQRLSGRKVDWGQVGTSALIGCATGMLGPLISGSKWFKRVAAMCGRNSFTEGTLVLMADGTRKPIEDVRVGDEVAATDPETGESGPRKVTALIRGSGEKNLVDITVTAADGRPDSLTATTEHPFWLPDSKAWAAADTLRPGQWLRTAAGTHVQITAIRHRTATADVFNLTVDDLHTYYVLAGDTSVLVHNTSPLCQNHGGAHGSPTGAGAVSGPAPQRAADMLDKVNKRPGGTGRVPGYNGNSNWGNNMGELPGGKYREWDVNAIDDLPVCSAPGCDKAIRGAERLLTPKDGPGPAYYTPDHYGTYYYVGEFLG
ncbi:RHS repeat-associated core domain-containing protein [Streptomyces sp. NPDC101490]|uniref:RHS repeat-associated core domain-containing protein n=1 Tax=Streptomyces sp. NPDC101490 TaxID=3366143 RepID=UPI0038110F28